MPDKIKEAYEALGNKDLFLDEMDFRENVTKDPKGTFEALNSYNKTKGLFLDYDDFETSLDLKKNTSPNQSSPSLPNFSTNVTQTYQTPLKSQSPLVSNLKSTSVTTKPKQVNPFEVKTKETQNPFTENKVLEYNPFVATVDEINNKVEEERIGKITQQQLDDNPRYQYLLNKKEAYERGYTDDKGLNGKTAEQKLFEDREPYLINKLDPKEQEEVKSLANYQSLMKIGKEKEAQVELQKYLNARSEWRKGIDDQIVEIKATLPNITDPTELQLAKRDIAELEIQKKPIYDPKAAMETILKENANEVAQIAKPTETPKERLRKYTNSLYGSVLRQKERLGIAEELDGVDRFLAERELYSQNKGAELEKLHQDELKLKNAIKIYELNRTPYEKDTALGVFAKSFAGEIAPYAKSKLGVDNTIANNIQAIVQDANIVDATNKEQLSLAKQYGDNYEFLSAKWAAQNLAPTAAIMTEMIPAAIATEGAFAIAGLGKLNRSIGLLSEYGKLGKASKVYFNTLQDSKIGRGLIKSAFSGLKYGIESEAAAQLAPQIKDEMGFANGLFAGAAGKALGGLTGKVLEKSLSSVGRMFGSQTPNAIRAIETYGNLISKAKDFSDKVVGETAEEYVEQLVGIYKQSEGYNSFIDNIRKHYETTDALEEFATILMMSIGAPAGSTLAKSLFDSSKKMYNTMNRAERRVADQMADEIHSENRQAMETAVEQTAKEEKIDLQEAENKSATKEEIKANEIANEKEPNIADNGLSNDVVEPIVETKEEQRIKELEELTFDEETQQRLDIYKAKDLERYKKELTKAAYKTDEGSKIVNKHKAEDILANEKSTVAEIIMAKEFLADNTRPFSDAMLTDIQRNIDSQLSTVGKGQGKASWNDTLRRQKKIYDEVSQAQAKIDEEIKAETNTTPSSSNNSEVSAPSVVEVKKLERKGTFAHTKGIFEDKEGKLYKSVEDNKTNEKTMEHDILKSLQSFSNIPKVGEIISTTEGDAFEIEKLSPISDRDKISLEDYRDIQKVAKELDDKGIFIGEHPDIGFDKNGKLKLYDFSLSRQKTDREKQDPNFDNTSTFAALKKHLKDDDKSVISYEDQVAYNKENEDFKTDVKGYLYNMKYRPFGIGTHPKEGFVKVENKTKSKDGVYATIEYNRPLTSAEVKSFELESAGRSENKYDTNKPTPIEANIPTSNKGTQTTEPIIKESEGQVEEKEEVVDPEIQRRDNLVNDLSTYNKLTKSAKASSKGVKMLNGIKTRATEMGFTTQENKGKLEVINVNGKRLTKSRTTEEVSEPTQEARNNFKKLFKEGVIVPSIVSQTLEPTQIRVAIEAFKKGKETKDVKRLMNEFADFNEDTDVKYREWDGNKWVGFSVPLSDMLTQEINVDNLTEKEINELADIYDDMFADTDEQTKNFLTNSFYEEQETRQQDQSEDSTSSKSSTKAKGTKTSEKVVKAVEKILENEFEANGSLSKDATIRTQKRNTAVKQVKSELDTKEAKAVETVIANYDKIRDILMKKEMISKINCKW